MSKALEVGVIVKVIAPGPYLGVVGSIQSMSDAEKSIGVSIAADALGWFKPSEVIRIDQEPSDAQGH